MTDEAKSQAPEVGAGRRKALLSAALVAAFLVAAALTTSRHEMWADEFQAWLIARDSSTLAEFFGNLRYEGHPYLWHAMLFVLTRATSDPVAMQVLHLAIATVAVFVFVHFSPFSPIQKALFCFGYFTLYEYAAISRCYVLGVLFIFSFCASYCGDAGPRFWTCVAFLCAASQTNAYALMVSGALALLLLHAWAREARGLPGGARVGVRAVAGLSVYGAFVLLAVFEMWPPADRSVFDSLQLDTPRIGLNAVWNAFVPIPEISHQFWNRHVVPAGYVTAALSAALLLSTSLFFLRTIPVLGAYLVGSGALVAFTHLAYYGGMRHHGHIFVLFVACLWAAAPRSPDLSVFGRRRTSGRSRALSAFLLLQTAGAVVACSVDWSYPFSQSRNAADYLRGAGLADAFIAGDLDYGVSPLTAHLGRAIYYPRRDRIGTFIVWDREREAWDDAVLLRTCEAKAVERGDAVLLVSNHKLAGLDASKIAEFTGSTVVEEQYYIYWVEPNLAPDRAAAGCDSGSGSGT